MCLRHPLKFQLDSKAERLGGTAVGYVRSMADTQPYSWRKNDKQKNHLLHVPKTLKEEKQKLFSNILKVSHGPKIGKGRVKVEQFSLLENISSVWNIQICFVNFHMGFMINNDFQTLHGQEAISFF